MTSIYEWMIVTSFFLVLDASLNSSAAQMMTDICCITVCFVLADLLWALWNLTWNAISPDSLPH